MRHLKSGRKLGRRADHRKAMIKNLTESLVIHGRIETTVTRAKEVRTYVEPLITKAKEGTLHARRIIASRLHTEAVAKKLFEELGVQFADRPGGYTRILKTSNRRGDAAPMAILELVAEPVAKKSKSKKKKDAPTAKAKPSSEVAKEEAVADEVAASPEVSSVTGDEVVETAPAESESVSETVEAGDSTETPEDTDVEDASPEETKE